MVKYLGQPNTANADPRMESPPSASGNKSLQTAAAALQPHHIPEPDQNVADVWDDYHGPEVIAGTMDAGTDCNHSYLSAAYRYDLDYDARDGGFNVFAAALDDGHGTVVSMVRTLP